MHPKCRGERRDERPIAPLGILGLGASWLVLDNAHQFSRFGDETVLVGLVRTDRTLEPLDLRQGFGEPVGCVHGPSQPAATDNRI